MEQTWDNSWLYKGFFSMTKRTDCKYSTPAVLTCQNLPNAYARNNLHCWLKLRKWERNVLKKKNNNKQKVHVLHKKILWKTKTKQDTVYCTCQLKCPPPRIQMETLRTGQFFIVFSPYMMIKIRKRQNFVILSGIYLPWYVHFVFAWIYTLLILPWCTFSQ